MPVLGTAGTAHPLRILPRFSAGTSRSVLQAQGCLVYRVDGNAEGAQPQMSGQDRRQGDDEDQNG